MPPRCQSPERVFRYSNALEASYTTVSGAVGTCCGEAANTRAAKAHESTPTVNKQIARLIVSPLLSEEWLRLGPPGRAVLGMPVAYPETLAGANSALFYDSCAFPACRCGG